MKKLLALLTIAGLLVVFTGCPSGTTKQKDDTKPKTDSTEVKPK